MGLDLRILPVYSKGADFSCTSLECDSDYDMFNQIRSIQGERGRDVSRKGLCGYIGDQFSTHENDAYGDVLQSVQAKDLKSINACNGSFTNRAIIAYINALDDQHECFLYWH